SWGRLSPHPRLVHVGDLERRRIIPTSVAPISLFPREESEWLRDVFHDDTALRGPDPFAQLSSVAQDLRRALHERGASFFADLVRMTNHLPTEVEEGLWELVAAGLVTADGFDNLRALMDPRRRRAEGRERSRRPRHAAGRWSLLRNAIDHPISALSTQHSHTESVARQLLRRYGVVFRDLLARESLVQSWRDLLVQYRRMELQGEIRGGRFVSGFTGEQFAFPEAVESLRAMRKRNESGVASHDIKLSASDPLNLAGVILPGPRVPAVPSNFVVFRDGVMVRTLLGREAADRPDAQIESSEQARRG
ncbi:MAG: Lhr family helicase, partial [Nitrospiraceae bacterium]